MEPTGPAQLVQRGHWRDVEWSLESQASTTGGICLTGHFDPAPDSFNTRVLSCGPRPSLELTSDPIMDLSFQQRAGMSYHLLIALTLPEIDRVEVEYEDGGSEVLNPVHGAVVILFDANRRIRNVVGHRNDGASPIRCSVIVLPAEFEELRCSGPRTLPTRS
jgi:hypothetical protein